MALTPGTRLGPYEIAALLGVGGMGEVYRATDTNLKRQVAIKVLPAPVAGDAERVTRFQREAEVLAALNHPNIAHIHGLEKSDGTIALVMELVEGPTLADRIAKSAIPIDEALPIVKQIAEALEAAHEQGIIHRDLKPANIKLRPDGAVKVLDFGLAKAMDPVGASRANLSMSPTITTPAMTHAGIILGTAAYMAPEQARGKPLDKRADIWAFGCVVYEMLMGERLFQGEDLTETLASVVKEQPDISKAPRTVQRLLRKCLEKDPRKRLRDIGDAWDLIDDDISHAPVQSTAGRRWIPWRSVAGVLAIGLAALSVAYVRSRPTGASGRRLHMSMLFPNNDAPGFIALSPDGRMLAYTDRLRIAVRSLETGEVNVLNGTEIARALFWSPDSRTIAFFSDNERALKTIAVSGGVPRILCTEVGGANGGGTWNRDGTILFSSDGRLIRTSAGGGACTTVEIPPERRYPVFLPDGDHFLIRQYGAQDADTGLMVSSLRDGTTKPLLGDATSGMFAPDAEGSTHGRLLFIRDRTLMAQPFDAGSLELSGNPTPVSRNASFDNNGQIAVSLAKDGTLVFLTGTRSEREMVWYDRSGAESGKVTGTGYQFAAPSLSSDGKRLLFVRQDGQTRRLLFWRDLQRNQEQQLTSPGLLALAAVWSPDAAQVVFGGRASGNDPGLFDRAVSGGADHLMLRSDGAPSPSDWTRDGRWVIYTDQSPKTGADIWAVPYPSNAESAKPVALLQTPAYESQAQVSPDGKWIAYTSDESGGLQVSRGLQVWVRPFAEGKPLPDTKWLVSSSGASGREARWRADSKELFYLELGSTVRTERLMTVAVGTGVDPFGPPKFLFSFPAGSYTAPQANVFLYAPSPNGQKFLVDRVATDVQPTLEMIVNWASTK